MAKYNLQKFIDAQAKDFETALREVKAGCKTSHWMWFIFPQIIGLAQSRTSIFYSIQNLEEASLYMADETLSAHMNEICNALLELDGNDAHKIFGYPDDMKLHSCMTLFAQACPDNDIFKKVIDKYFEGEEDRRTIELIGWKTFVDSNE